MKIVTWNVNSIRARLDRVVDWLDRQQPDVVCLQETKVEDSAFPYEPLGNLGYDALHLGQRTYNGVAILLRGRASNVVRGFADGGEEDPQSRLIACDLPLGPNQVRVVSVYVPNGQSVGSDKYAYKLAWLERFKAYLTPLAQSDKPLVVCGDYNIAPSDLDVHDPASWQGSVLCSEAERAAFRQLLSVGMHDVYRTLQPERRAFTWWDYRAGALRRDAGLRIDHFLANRAAMEHAASVNVDRNEREGDNASDHAPVWLDWR